MKKNYLVTVDEKVCKTYCQYKVLVSTEKQGVERNKAFVEYVAKHFNYTDVANLKIKHVTVYEFIDLD